MPLKQNSLHTLWACCHHWASQMTFHPKLKMIWNISLMWIFSTYRNKSKSRRDEGETDWSWCGDGGTHRRRRKRHILNPKIQMCPILPHQLETRTAVPFRYFQSGGGWHEGTKWVERMSCRAVMRRVMLRDRQVWSGVLKWMKPPPLTVRGDIWGTAAIAVCRLSTLDVQVQ